MCRFKLGELSAPGLFRAERHDILNPSRRIGVLSIFSLAAGRICTPKTGSRYVGLAHPQGGSGYVGFGTAKLGLSVWDGTAYANISLKQQLCYGTGYFHLRIRFLFLYARPYIHDQQ